MNVISRYYQIQQHFAASEQDKRAVQRPIHEETSRMAGDPPNGLPRKPPLGSRETGRIAKVASHQRAWRASTTAAGNVAGRQYIPGHDGHGDPAAQPTLDALGTDERRWAEMGGVGPEEQAQRAAKPVLVPVRLESGTEDHEIEGEWGGTLRRTAVTVHLGRHQLGSPSAAASLKVGGGEAASLWREDGRLATCLDVRGSTARSTCSWRSSLRPACTSTGNVPVS